MIRREIGPKQDLTCNNALEEKGFIAHTFAICAVGWSNIEMILFFYDSIGLILWKVNVFNHDSNIQG